MMTPGTRTTRSRVTGALFFGFALAMSVVLSGCGTNAAPSATQTQTTSVSLTPSPTPLETATVGELPATPHAKTSAPPETSHVATPGTVSPGPTSRGSSTGPMSLALFTPSVMKELLGSLNTLGGIKNRFKLTIVKGSNDGTVLTAMSDVIPGVKFIFINGHNVQDADKYVLQSLDGPASILLPDYVDKPLTSIPHFEQDRPWSGVATDDFGRYDIDFGINGSSILKPNCSVSMWVP